MSRNNNARFLTAAGIGVNRSSFDRSSETITTLNVGKLTPIYIDEILPGDTVKIDSAMIARMVTPLSPFFGNMYMDVYFFYVPNRLLWKHWENFLGANSQPWYSNTTYTIPTGTLENVAIASTDVDKLNMVATYFGLPVNDSSGGNQVQELPFRAYNLIWNKFFRDENLQAEVAFNDEDGVVLDIDAYTLLNAAKAHDYFTSCLPSPQKGAAVNLPFSGVADVYYETGLVSTSNPPSFVTSAGTAGGYTGNIQQVSPGSGWNDYRIATGSTSSALAYDPAGTLKTSFTSVELTINELRLAIATQQFLELAARGGTRINEVMWNFFKVRTPDSRIQFPEYLGGKRIPINVNQVVQTSSQTNDETTLGSTGAVSVTRDAGHMFTKSFVEHGWLLGLAVIRYDHVYANRIDRMFSREQIYDYYWPQFDNIGEQAVMKKELYCDKNTPDEVFGYQEAWAEYRYKPSMVTGAFNPYLTAPLNGWTLVDKYTSQPVLGSSWIQEDRSNVLNVMSYKNGPDFYFNGFFKAIYTRPMSVHSIPGLKRI